ncbi:MAG: hypothetical protein E4H13_04990 [Calditrichales bacterium]|nr:MAG: hypothetical protein E4H13_04990 [Calditrichales bacterium]
MKFIKIISLVVLLSFAAYGQDYMTTLTYNISVPAGETAYFIENPSYLGISFDARKYVLPFFSVGFYSGWQVFYDQSTDLIQLERGTVSGKQYRHINTFPVMLNAHLYLGGEQCFRPYVGINAGAYYTWKRFAVGVITLEEKKWVWGFAPEAGFTIPVGDVHVNLSGKLNYALPPSESAYSQDPAPLQYVSFHIGFAYYR